MKIIIVGNMLMVLFTGLDPSINHRFKSVIIQDPYPIADCVTVPYVDKKYVCDKNGDDWYFTDNELNRFITESSAIFYDEPYEPSLKEAETIVWATCLYNADTNVALKCFNWSLDTNQNITIIK